MMLNKLLVMDCAIWEKNRVEVSMNRKITEIWLNIK